MSHERHNRVLFQPLARVALWVAVLSVGVGIADRVDGGGPPASIKDGETALLAPNLDWSHAQRVYRVVEGWVTKGAVDRGAAAEPIPASGVVGLRVTIRWSGFLLGVGDSYPRVADVAASDVRSRPGQQDVPGAVDLTVLAAEATGQALGAVEAKLGDLFNQPAAGGAAVPALMDIAQNMQVDIQIGHSPQRVVIMGKHNPRVLYHSFAAGYHGLHLTRQAEPGQASEAWVWPASALSANLSPRGQMMRLLTDAGCDVKGLEFVGRNADPRLERFEVIHVVRPAVDMPVTRLSRGNEVLPVSSLDSRSLEGVARRLTEFLLKRVLPDGQVAGVYHPSTDRYDPAVADARDQALAAYALSQREIFLAGVNPDDPQLSQVSEAVKLVVRDLCGRVSRDGEADQDRLAEEAAVTGLLLMTLVEGRGLEQQRPYRDKLVGRILSWRQDSGLFGNNKGDRFNRPTQALLVAALSSVYEQTRDKNVGQCVLQSQQELWRDAGPSKVINSLPWLTMTEFRLLRLNMLDDGESSWSRRGRMLGELVDVVRGRQVTAAKANGCDDAVGGFDLMATGEGGFPDPEWHSAHMLAFLASAMRQRDLSHSRDEVSWLLDCGLTARFLAQMMFDEPACFYVRSREDALGGVRTALWDNRLGVGPTAMSLLAISELQKSSAQMAEKILLTK